MTQALEKIFGRHQAEIRTIQGVYLKEASGKDSKISEVKNLIDKFVFF